MIERSVIVCDTQDLSIDESWLRKRPSELRPENPLALPEKMAAHEKEIIEAALRESGGQGLRTFGSGRQIGYATIDLGVKDTIAENK